MDHNFPLLFMGQVAELAADFTRDEIWNALFSMDHLKAPRPEGFLASFFQKSWSVVGDSITVMVTGILRGWAQLFLPLLVTFLSP